MLLVTLCRRQKTLQYTNFSTTATDSSDAAEEITYVTLPFAMDQFLSQFLTKNIPVNRYACSSCCSLSGSYCLFLLLLVSTSTIEPNRTHPFLIIPQERLNPAPERILYNNLSLKTAASLYTGNFNRLTHVLVVGNLD